MNLIDRLRYLGEINGNLIHDKFCMLFAKSLNRPFNRIGVFFGEIAGLACRQDIACGVPAARAYWDVMFLMENFIEIKQTRRIFAISTCAIEVRQGEFPITLGESMRETSFSCAASMLFGSAFVEIVLLPATVRTLLFLRVNLLVSTLNLAYFIGVLCSVISASLLLFFFVSIVISPTSIINQISIVGAILGVLFTNAISANAFSTIRTSFICPEILGNSKYVLVALGAASYWGIHSASLSLYLMLMSAGGEINRRFGLQSLADNSQLYRQSARSAI